MAFFNKIYPCHSKNREQQTTVLSLLNGHHGKTYVSVRLTNHHQTSSKARKPPSKLTDLTIWRNNHSTKITSKRIRYKMQLLSKKPRKRTITSAPTQKLQKTCYPNRTQCSFPSICHTWTRTTVSKINCSKSTATILLTSSVSRR